MSERKFDRDLARRMYRKTLPNGRKVWTQALLATHFGVAQNAIHRAVSIREMAPPDRVRELTRTIGGQS